MHLPGPGHLIFSRLTSTDNFVRMPWTMRGQHWPGQMRQKSKCTCCNACFHESCKTTPATKAPRCQPRLKRCCEDQQRLIWKHWLKPLTNAVKPQQQRQQQPVQAQKSPSKLQLLQKFPCRQKLPSMPCSLSQLPQKFPHRQKSPSKRCTMPQLPQKFRRRQKFQASAAACPVAPEVPLQAEVPKQAMPVATEVPQASQKSPSKLCQLPQKFRMASQKSPSKPQLPQKFRMTQQKPPSTRQASCQRLHLSSSLAT